MSAYPEHDKLLECKDDREAIGEFIDIGLGRLFDGMAIYEKRSIACECKMCLKGRGHEDLWHTEDERASAVDGVVMTEQWVPTHRSVADILAEYFGIDRAKIDAEKTAMLEAVRGG